MTSDIMQAEPCHAGVLAALHAHSFSEADRWDEAAFSELFTLFGVLTGLALHQDQPAGFIMVRSAVGEAEILTVCVDPAYRRQGIARKLLQWAEQTVYDNGAERFFLEVSKANESAQALYFSEGFAEVGVRKRYYPDGSDALLLCRQWAC